MKKILLSAILIATTSFYAQDGKVGVGNTDPKATLDVTGTPATATVADGIIAPRLTGDQLTAKNAVYVAAQTGTQVYVTAAATTPAGKTINVTAPGYYYFDGSVWQKYTTGKTKFVDGTNVADAVYTSGNVGIGSMVPLSALTVKSDGSSNNINTTLTRTGAGTIGLSFEQIGIASYGIGTEDTTGDFVFKNNWYNAFAGTEQLRIQRSNGNLGIGTTSPTEKLHVNGGARVSSLAGTGERMVVADADGKLTTQPIPGGATYTGSTSVVLNGSSFERAALTGDVTAAQNSNALTITNGAVTSAKIADATIATADLANGAVTAAKLDQMAATNGQVLKWNGTAWAPAADNNTTTDGSETKVTAGTNVTITGVGTTASPYIVNSAIETATQTPSTAITGSATQVAVPSTNVQGAIGDLATAVKTAGNNVYAANGSLAGNRTVAQEGNTLAFTSTATTGTSHFTVDGSTLNVDAANNRVGIGTAAPSSALTVKSDGSSNNINTMLTRTGAGTIGLSFQQVGIASYGIGTEATTGDFVFKDNWYDAFAGTEQLRIQRSTGNLGIRTNDPKATLDVAGTPATATVADGIIAPRLTGDQLTAKNAVYVAAQTGTQVYVTAAATTPAGKTINVTAPGYYYFDGSEWKKLAVGNTDKQLGTDNQTIPATTNRNITLTDRITSKINIAPAGEETNLSTLNVIGGGPLGGFSNGITISSGNTNATDKYASIKVPQYNISYPPVQAFTMVNNSTSNQLYIGGNNSSSQAAVSDIFFTVDSDTDLSNSAGIGALFPMVIKGVTGFVGIGTFVPTSALTIQNNTSSSNNINTTFRRTGAGTIGLSFEQIGIASYGIGAEATTGDFVFRNNWYEASAGTEQLRIKRSNGNVGIGTTNPTSKLAVVGLPVFADNAAAASLSVGDFYRTADGTVKVKY
jgi:hypothetical protein